MKKLLTIVFLFVSLTIFSQNVFNYKAINYSYSYETNGVWTKYTEWIACDVNVTANFKKGLIDVDNKNDDIFYIYSSRDPFTTNDGIKVLTLSCRDKNDGYCQCHFMEAGNNTLFLLIEYSDARVMYNLRSL